VTADAWPVVAAAVLLGPAAIAGAIIGTRWRAVSTLSDDLNGDTER
jgi:hypothetical protein